MRQKPKILIIEDDRTLKMILDASLSDSYEVTFVDNLEDAKRCITEHAYDAIIADNQFPDKPGGEVGEHAADVIYATRASENNGNTPIIVHSGTVGEELRGAIRGAKHVRCLMKGGSHEALCRTIADCVGAAAAGPGEVPTEIDPGKVIGVETHSPILANPIENILVLDYYNGTAEAMKGLLEDVYPGSDVDAFHTLEDALEGISKKAYDLIISNSERTVRNGVDSPSAVDISGQLHAYARTDETSHNLETPIIFYGDGESIGLAGKYKSDRGVLCIGAPDSETIQNAVNGLYERIDGVVNPRHVERIERYRGRGPAEPTPGDR